MDINSHWYSAKPTPLTVALKPLSYVFKSIVLARQAAYQLGFKKIHYFAVPVIVVGNITVGGTGKTPFVIWLAQFLQQQGFRPGIVSRGYRSKNSGLSLVTPHSDANRVGDEAILLAERSACPVVIGKNRVAAVKKLLAETECNIVISDDGLQHYRLGRDIEIAMVDGRRQFGNQQFLPAGPLREAVSRLEQVDFVITQNSTVASHYDMVLKGDSLISLYDQHKIQLSDFNQQTVHAIAAIGNPQRFFNYLRQAGLHVIEHEFRDHHYFTHDDIHFTDGFPVIMTEKDAVKCRDIASAKHWFLPVTAEVSPQIKTELLAKIKEKICVA